jgi:hypothetical protein
MKCEKFQRVAGQMARNEIMDAHVRAQALAHTTVCKGCAEILGLQSVLSDGLRSLAEHTKNAGPGIDLEDEVLAAFRERTSAVSVSASSGYWRYWAAAVAAVLLLAIGLAAWRWYDAPLPRQTQQANSRELAPPAVSSNRHELPVATAGQTPAPKRPNVTPLGKFQRRPKAAARTPRINVARQSLKSLPPATPPATQEVVTHFVSLGYGSALDLQDGAQMVRVELPRSALARFGLPMNMDRADERITADVLVGADGLARAIRFVQPTDQTTGNPRSGNERNEQ